MGSTSEARLHLMTLRPVGDTSVTARVYLWPLEAIRPLARLGGTAQRDFRNKWGAIARALGDLQAFGPYSSVKVGLPRQCDAPQAIAVSLGSPDAALIADAIGLLGSWLVDTSSSLADDAGARDAALGSLEALRCALASGACAEEVSFGFASPASDPRLSTLAYDALGLAVSERLAGLPTPFVDRDGHACTLVPGPHGGLMTIPCCPPAGRWRRSGDPTTNLASLALDVRVNDRPMSVGHRVVDVYPSVSRFLDAPFRDNAYLPHDVSAYFLAGGHDPAGDARWLRIPVTWSGDGTYAYDGCAPKLYRALALGTASLPPAQDLVRDPASHPNAYVSFSEGLDSADNVFERGHHMHVRKGVPMPDREALMASVAAALDGIMEPVAPLDRQDAWPEDGRKRVRLLNTVPAFPESSLAYRDKGDLDIASWDALEDPFAPPKSDPRSDKRRAEAQATQRRRIRAASTVDGKAASASLTILLVADTSAVGYERTHHDCDDLRRYAIPEIGRILGPALSGEPVEGLAVTVRPVGLDGTLYDPDEVNDYSARPSGRLLETLRDACGCSPSRPGDATCALVMLPARQWFQAREAYRYDPKPALRAAFAALGVVTQFVTPRNAATTPWEGGAGASQELATRVCSAVRDLLCHMGATNLPPAHGKAGQHGCPVPGRFGFVTVLKGPRPHRGRPRSGGHGRQVSFPVAMVMDFDLGTRVVVTPAFGPSGTQSDGCRPMTYAQFLVNVARLANPGLFGDGEPPSDRLGDVGRHRLMRATLEACVGAIPPDGKRTILLFPGKGVGPYAGFLNNVGDSGSEAAAAARRFGGSGLLRLGRDDGLEVTFRADDPLRPIDICRIRTGAESDFVPTYFKDSRVLPDGSVRFGEYSGVYLCPEWGVAYICNSTGKNDPTYKANALYGDNDLGNGGAWRDSRLRALSEVLPYLRDSQADDAGRWSADALDLAVQVARTQGGSFGGYRDPLATPIGFLLLDEAKKYALPTQQIRFKSGRASPEDR